MMTTAEKRRLRNRLLQATTTEEDLKACIRDWARDLEAADPGFEPGKIAILSAQLVDFKDQLRRIQEEADRLRVQVRELDIPPAEPIHPGGAVAAILERDKRPTQWGMGGDINSRDADWEAPEVEGSNRKRNRK
jgi:hypothetical protein